MSADFNTRITVKGTLDELQSILEAIQKYNKKTSDVYVELNTIEAAKQEEMYARFSSLEEIMEYLKSASGKVTIDLSGPYGNFGLLNDVELFEDMAIAAPGASFQGDISGFSNYGRMTYTGKLTRKKLHLLFSYGEDDNEEESVFDSIERKYM